jgi:hypothetical protein
LACRKSKRRREARQRPRHECACALVLRVPDITPMRGIEARRGERGFRRPMTRSTCRKGACRAAGQAGRKLRQQGRDFVAMHGDKRTRMDGVVTSHGPSRQDRIDRSETALRRNVVGTAQPLGTITSGACGRPQVRAKRLAIPPQQWTSYSHDGTLFRECRALNIFDAGVFLIPVLQPRGV